jgi:hypothetical protein
MLRLDINFGEQISKIILIGQYQRSNFNLNRDCCSRFRKVLAVHFESMSRAHVVLTTSDVPLERPARFQFWANLMHIMYKYIKLEILPKSALGL